MRASDLGRLLEFTVEYGAIPLTKLRELFALYDPGQVSQCVTDLGPWIIQKRPLTMAVFLQALDNLKGQVPDVVSAGVISLECRRKLGAKSVKDEDVIAIAKGLAILIPDLVGVEGDKIAVNASASRVAAAVASQLEQLHELQEAASSEAGGDS